MNDQEIIELYKPLVSYIADIFGEHCEVLLHDLQDLENSIVAIENNHITNRDINDSVTDFALEIINNPENYENKNYITNYKGKTEDSAKTLSSSTYFIKNKKKELIGLLCVNIDVTAFEEAKKFIDDMFLFTNNNEDSAREPREEFKPDIKEIVNAKIEKSLAKYDIEPSRMTPEERKRVIKQLDENGVFLIKDSITRVASKLQVSKQTIYRYLDEIN